MRGTHLPCRKESKLLSLDGGEAEQASTFSLRREDGIVVPTRRYCRLNGTVFESHRGVFESQRGG